MTQPIRYYGRPIEVSYFKGRGWRGRWILFLHGLVLWLHRRIEYHVMLFIAKRQEFAPGAVKTLKLTFRNETEKLKNDPRSGRKRSKLAAFGVHDPVDSREERYAEGRKNSKEDHDPARDATSIQATIARLSQTGRATRYTGGRHTYEVQDFSRTTDNAQGEQP